MLKRYGIAALAAVLAVLSCTHREESGIQKVKFQAVQADGPSTKTVLQADGSVFWSPGDAVSLFYGGATIQKTKLTAENTSAAAQTTFSGVLDGFLPDGSTSFWAVYPYAAETAFDGSAVTVTVPAEQTAVAGTFASDAFVSIATSKDYTLQFYNLCGGIKFSVANQGITSVIFKGNSDEILAGQVHAAFDENGRPVVTEVVKGAMELVLNAPEGGFEVGKWYYMVSLPAELTNGYRMSFYGQDGEMVAERISEDPVTIKRAVWGKLTEADYVAESISPSKYLTFTSTETTTIFLSNSGANAPVLYYSTDAQNWTLWDYSELTFTADAPLYICGDNPDGFSFAENRNSTFLTSGASFSSDMYSVSGDIMSLINMESDVLEIPNPYCFYNLFGTNEKLISAPTLPATTLTEGCYKSMFGACSNLVEAPALPATTLAESCYHSMFAHCSSLAEAPDLPAAELAKGCYAYMFYDCGSLEAAPSLSAATLAEECYRGMFYSSGKLSYIKCLATDFSASDCLSDWVYGVATTGTFVKMFDAQWSTGNSGIPEGWTVETDGLPNNEIWYTSTDGNVVPLNETYINEFGASLVSNTYENGKGVISFDGPITKIATSAFRDCTTLETVSYISNTVTRLNWGAFLSCSNLVSVKLPDSLEQIDNYVFNNTALEEITIPESVTYISPHGVFGERTPMKAFYGKGASEDHSCLVSQGYLVGIANKSQELDFVAPEGVKSFGNGIFDFYCYYKSITVPESFDGSGDYSGFGSPQRLSAFYGSHVSADNRCLILGDTLVYFAHYNLGASTYTVAEPVKVIGHGAFYNQNNSSLKELILPETVETLKESFMGLSGIETIQLPSSLKVIEDEAFFSAVNLKRLTVPASVESLGSQLFRGAGRGYAGQGTGLSDVTFLSTTPPAIKSDTFDDMVSDCPLYVPAESVDVYKSAENWSKYADRILPIGGDISASKYLTFTSEGTTKLSLANFNNNAPVLYYSTDAQNWTQWDYSELTFSANAPLYICGDNPNGFSDNSTILYSTFVTSGSNFAVSGSIMSLLDKDVELDTIPSNSSFGYLFNGCTGLTSAPSLPATTLTMSCYQQMFKGCSSLKDAPELPATTLAVQCYQEMFFDCSSLTSAPVLPATIMAQQCYDQMFYGCTSLETAPELPATTLANYCYQAMFGVCTSLAAAPELPATALNVGCYFLMFTSCSSLGSAPVLPAATLEELCYSGMFSDCSELSYVKCLATDISASKCLNNWLGAVADTGVFVKAPDVAWPEGASGIPTGWEVEVDGESTITASKYLTFTSTGTTTVSLTNEEGNAPVLYYSTDAQNWTQWDYSGLTFTGAAPLYICGDNPDGFSFSLNPDKISTFTAAGDPFSVSGDIMSLVKLDGERTDIPYPGCFKNLFRGCTLLISAPSLTATTLTGGCYTSMFSGCTGLTVAPELPATTLQTYCYAQMFEGCTGLTVAPELSATSLDYGCYSGMFWGCEGLTTAPALPATTLAEYCYENMFYGCTNLTEAPELPATTLATQCYQVMFADCTSLSAAPELPATNLASGCYNMMFSGCTKLEEAPELPATTLASNCYWDMFSNCTSLTSAPTLPAATLPSGAYGQMFRGCSNLSFVTCLATDISANSCLYNWLNGVADTGTFVKSPNIQWPSGTSGIPEGWTVQDAEAVDLDGRWEALRNNDDPTSVAFVALFEGSNLDLYIIAWGQHYVGTYQYADGAIVYTISEAYQAYTDVTFDEEGHMTSHSWQAGNLDASTLTLSAGYDWYEMDPETLADYKVDLAEFSFQLQAGNASATSALFGLDLVFTKVN